jgi:hypothetical protein
MTEKEFHFTYSEPVSFSGLVIPANSITIYGTAGQI